MDRTTTTSSSPSADRAFERALEGAGFRRDSRLGAILHGRKTSFREVATRDSLHVVIDGQQVSAHVDRISPLNHGRDGRCRYGWLSVLAHNVAVLVDKLHRRLQGLRDQHRCELDCEIVWVDDEDDESGPTVELDCTEKAG